MAINWYLEMIWWAHSVSRDLTQNLARQIESRTVKLRYTAENKPSSNELSEPSGTNGKSQANLIKLASKQYHKQYNRIMIYVQSADTLCHSGLLKMMSTQLGPLFGY